MKKRTISLLLALCMVFSMAMPAFAVGPDSAAIESPATTQEATPTPEDTTPVPTDPEADPSQEESAALPEEPTVQEDAAELTDEPAEEPAESATLAAQPTSAPTIPGYTQVTSANLDLSKYYMFVSADAQGNLYAFYPAEAHANDDPGNTIVGNRFDAGAFVAQLTVNHDNTISAKWLKDNTTVLDMDKLLFTTQHSNGYTFKTSGEYYLALTTAMLATTPTEFSVSLRSNTDHGFNIATAKRILTFNKANDPSEFRPGSGYTTNFWGPGEESGLPIYLYTKDGAVAPVEVNKTELKQAIADAEGLKDNALYTEESRNTLTSLLAAAKAEDGNQGSTLESVKEATQNLVHAMQAMKPVADKIAAGAPDGGTTTGQPFPAGTGTSKTFRIPAITTLKDGSVAAAIDARWDNSPDGDNIDTLFSISNDNGKTWKYSFPNFFNDSVNKRHDLSTAFLDPVMVQGNDGTIYLMTDLFPAGSYIASVNNSTGYELIDGKQRMVLYNTPVNGQTSTNYTYYVGDFATAGANGKAFAPVIAKGDDTLTAAFYVDEHYYLYTAEKKHMYCQQLGSDMYVEQNVFFYNADLHVRNATYLWLVTSKDNGKTWSAPTIMNPLVRPDKENNTHRFYGVGPGAGLALKDGTVMLTCYINDARTSEKSSFIYTRDNGETWHRSDNATTGSDWSSESTLVQIDDTTVRQFCRDGYGVLRYTDHVWNGTEWKRSGDPVSLNDVPKTVYNQLSAIRYSKLINGKPVILVSTATTGNRDRMNGKIYALNLNEDKTMTLLSSYEVTKPGVTYGYSSLTEQKDGSIGLLYEDTFVHGTYLNIPLNKIIPDAIVDGERSYYVPMFGTQEFTFDPLPTEDELKALDSSIVSAEIKGDKVVFTGLKVGSTSFTSNGIVTNIHVESNYPTKELTLSCHGEEKFTVGANPGVVNLSDAIATKLDPITATGGQGTLGNNASFNGDYEALALSMYTFHQNEKGYEVSAPAANGTMTWVDVDAGIGSPMSSTATTTKFIPNQDGSFCIQSNNQNYLYFWHDRTKYHFDRTTDCGGRFTDGCKFMLYRPVNNGENSSTELPGYVKATQIEDGAKYLIVAQSDGKYFVMRPTTDGNKYAHLLKVDPAKEQTTVTIANVLTLTAQGKAGTFNVLADGTAYEITVQHQLTRVDRVEPTATTDGNILYWHCEICGQNFSDEAGTQPVDDVVIPAGTPLVPVDPSVPAEHPVQTDGNTPNGSSNTKPAENPATGDSSNLGIWLAVFVLAGAGVGVTAYQKKRKHQA